MELPSLDTLSTELLVKIFKYLDVLELCRLKQTCRRFHEIIETWGHLFIAKSSLLVTNQVHSLLINRSGRILSPFERLRISNNWKCGIYAEKSLLFTNTKFIPWLHLDKDLLWFSRGGHVNAYKRTSNGIDISKLVYTIKGKTSAEVCRFVKKNNHILSGQTDGSLWLWSVEDNKFIFDLENCHTSDINSVDMCGETMVSGSKDNYVKIWRKSDTNSQMYFGRINLFDRVWSVALSDDDKSLLAVGTAGNSYITTVTVLDMINQKTIAKLGSERLGAGVLDMQWDTASTLWSCGYDGHLRRWDLRTGNCEQAFEDPCESVVYCFQYDHLNTIISGTQSNGRVVLWDTRQTNYVQMYFMDYCRRRDKSSPIYGLSYDAEFLFTATDQHLNILNFSIFNGKIRDYSNLFLKLIKA